MIKEITDDLQSVYAEITGEKEYANTYRRLADFDEAAQEMFDAYQEFPNFKQLQAYFTKCLTGNNNWRLEEVKYKLNYAINKVYFNNN